MSKNSGQNDDKPILPGEKMLTVTDVPGLDIGKMMQPGTQKRQPMRGFDDDYVDIVDYIIRCTHKIWEEKAVGLIYTHYNHNAVIHMTDGTTYGRDKVVADTMRTLAAFPDARLFGDDVIWTGNDIDGFHSSHRITWIANNTGYSQYGPPTGKRIMRRTIAHCFVKENRIVEEWLTRDELAAVRQMGYNEFELARKFALREAAAGAKSPAQTGTGEVDRLQGQLPPLDYPPPGNPNFDPEYFVRRALHEIWNCRMLNKIQDYYVPNYACVASTNRELYGLGEFSAYIIQLIGAFPDCRLLVDWVGVLGDPTAGYRVAVRWILHGTHQGAGWYGEPTGKRIRLIGQTHYHIQNDKFVREWTIFDEFALLKQICWPD
jgi:predicted ester cyclase